MALLGPHFSLENMASLRFALWGAVSTSWVLAQQWNVSFDETRAAIASFFVNVPNGAAAQLVSPYAADNAPCIYQRDANITACAEVESCSPASAASWTCALRFSAASLNDTCGMQAVLNATYTVAVAEIQDAGVMLNQTLSLRPSVLGCAPAGLFSVRIPRAVTLSGYAAGASGTRSINAYTAAGALTAFNVTTGDEPNGLLFVSAGTYTLGPHKVTPAYPDFTLQVPAVDEFVVMPDGTGAPLRLSLQADPWFLTSFTWGEFPWSNAFEWSMNCSDSNIGCFGDAMPVETRSTYTVIAVDGDASLDAMMRKLYAVALADVAPAPSWVHEVALTNYDFFSPLPPSLNGFEADMQALAAALPANVSRSAIATCVHGWYGLVGEYTLTNLSNPALADSWTVFPSGAGFRNPVTNQPMGPVPMTKSLLHARLQSSRSQGFRTLLYFSDSLNSYTGVSFASEQVALSTIPPGYEWTGPDTSGTPFFMNPLHPATRAQVLNYTRLLMDEYGPDVDGFVWDETFMLAHDQPGDARAPGYAARAFMQLIADVRALMKSHPNCNGCVLMVADCMREMPMALVADGTYEDTGLDGGAAAAGTFRNYRNALWECGWADITRGYDLRNSTEEVYVAFNVGTGMSNGWGDFRGFANMTAEQQAYFVGLASRHNPLTGPRPPAQAQARGARV